MTFREFKDGRVKCLIATNVAARGLDIPLVDLVIQMEPPSRAEDYVHRSGRTGRAGKNGICILFYNPRAYFQVTNIEVILVVCESIDFLTGELESFSLGPG